MAARTESELLSTARDSMSRIEKWMKVNHLKINYKKSHWVILSTLPDYYPWLKKSNVGFYRIEPVLSVKYLGVISR